MNKEMKAFNPEMIILYGSYAKGTQTESSDIDIDDRIEPILIESTSDRSGFLHSIMSTGEIVYKRQ